MRTLRYTLTVSFLLTIVLSAFGTPTDKTKLFEYDKQKVQQKFKSVTQLEAEVKAHPNTSIKEIKQQKPGLVKAANLKNNVNASTIMADEDPPAGIPSIVWGLCLGVWGILIVWLVTESSEETKNAAIGCVISGAAYALFYIAYAAFWSSTGCWYYY